MQWDTNKATFVWAHAQTQHRQGHNTNNQPHTCGVPVLMIHGTHGTCEIQTVDFACS